ncbi:MAG: hypothetical protein KIT66_03880 [Chitinophagaceae bacterium]|nr:hypothetical protein [Chitinophagaceae bacterium]
MMVKERLKAMVRPTSALGLRAMALQRSYGQANLGFRLACNGPPTKLWSGQPQLQAITTFLCRPSNEAMVRPTSASGNNHIFVQALQRSYGQANLSFRLARIGPTIAVNEKNTHHIPTLSTF